MSPLRSSSRKTSQVAQRPDEVAVGDEHARRARVRAEHGDGLAALHEERLVVLERAKRAHDGVEALPVTRGLSSAAVDDEIIGTLGDVGIEIVHEHAERGFLLPSLAGERVAARGAHGAGACGRLDQCGGHANIEVEGAGSSSNCVTSSKVPLPIALRIVAMSLLSTRSRSRRGTSSRTCACRRATRRAGWSGAR